VDEHAVARLDRHLHEIFVRAVHKGCAFESGDRRPASDEHRACLGRRHEKAAEFRTEAAGRQHLHGTRQIHRALIHHQFHAGMRFIRCSKHRSALVRLSIAYFSATVIVAKAVRHRRDR
jgi:hypothetical protein